ncbi:gfo/Idh/MocA family oxidoreductase, partial [Blautia sp. AF19-34]
RAVPTWGVFLNEEEQGGGPLIDIGTHALDLTLWMMDNYEVESVTGQTFRKLADQTNQGNDFGDWDPKEFSVEDSAFGFIRMKNGAVIELEAAWALNTLEVDEAKTSLCGTKAGADMKDGLRINYIHHNKQVVEKPALFGEGVAFFSGEEKEAPDYEQELFYHIVADGAEQIVKPAQAAVVTRVLEAIYESAKSGKTIYFD